MKKNYSEKQKSEIISRYLSGISVTKNGRIPYSVIEHLTGLKGITLGSKPHYRIINCTTMVRFEIILGICFVVWTVLEKVSDKQILCKRT